jgi:hypothetical protein
MGNNRKGFREKYKALRLMAEMTIIKNSLLLKEADSFLRFEDSEKAQ